MNAASTTVIACTLSADDLQARLRRIAELGREHLLFEAWHGHQLRLQYATAARDELREIVRLESQCCAFLTFAVDERAQAVHLTISAPIEAGEAAGLLFEHFTGGTRFSSMPDTNCRPSCGCEREVEPAPAVLVTPVHFPA